MTKEHTETTEIQLVQKPEIRHSLQVVGARVTERLAELGVDTLVATEDTVKTLKELRAELNKELDSYEAQRKWVKEGVLNPYNEFEAIYKAEISEKYKAAIDTLKDKIAIVETKIKTEKRDRVKLYFDELCAAEGIDFIPFEKAIPEINISTSEKKYRDQLNEIVIKVKDELALIATEEHQAEILVEYKKTLNSALAITTVRTRKEAEKEELRMQKALEYASRVKRVMDAGMFHDSFTKSYIYNDEVFMSDAFLMEATKEDFDKELGVLAGKIAADKVSPQQAQMEFNAAPAPEVKTEEKLVKAQFEVTGTMAQLKNLGVYMRTNGIQYKNI
jgi:hypothetical protein